ncbi:sialate O-acetylesterase [Marinoscillum furvescens]|uniref:Sialate O-acetylesterase n=1 Tax=Marinoscillum furvescens DSM 4134 TaxID=1122208 RepID=A0A3D9L7B0_MARFU|nr:sialate O-acetylesterase [Marinoscillum furvescens]REE02205.1 sialate O-acetylesterase [Marinoscillum furvescens DSM 4134]
MPFFYSTACWLRLWCTPCLFIFLSITAKAEITLPAIIGDHMVLQQQTTAQIWGWTSRSNEAIRVWASWGSDTVTTKAVRGDWKVALPTPKAGGPHTLYIAGHDTVVVKDVLIGEVWLASGQSNMEMPVDSIHAGFPGMTNFREEIAQADQPEIRLFLVQKRVADAPQLDVQGEWKVCSSESVRDFSAVAYAFADRLHSTLSRPIGMIASSWGGTNAEVWMPADSVLGDSLLTSPFVGLKEGNRWPSLPGKAYNAMIYPLRHFALKGAIWYQGESNRLRPETYPQVMAKLINTWRSHWGDEMPFYFSEIAPYKYWSARELVPYLKQAQAECMEIPYTGMVVTNDLGDLGHIHPRSKRQVGERLAAWALAKDYQVDVAYSGPVYKSHTIDRRKVVVNFAFAEGLKSVDGPLRDFEVSNEQGEWFSATAKIINGQVHVWAKEVRNPAAVRFAWSDVAEPNLVNAAGLPAACFNTAP